MDFKGKTREELENKIKDLEGIISRKGVGSKYLQKAERIQRDVNIALLLGATTAVLSLATWLALKERD